MDRFYNSFRLKLTLLCLGTLFLIMCAVHVAMYVIIRNIISDQIGQSAESIATAVSSSIMADVDSYKQFLETRDVKSDYYRRMQRYLAKIKSSDAKIKFVFTERAADGKTEFLLDAEPIGSRDYSAPGDTNSMDPSSQAAYATGLPARLKPTETDFGTLLGGRVPIFDTDGKILGLVGVDFEVSEVFSYLNSLQFIMLGLYVIVLAICLALIERFSNMVLEPMIKDKMTGAYSKRYYETLMRWEIKKARKDGTDLAVLMLDLDHFKKINDTYGHGFGDRVLESVSKTVMSCLREDDYFIRYGGEEFVVLIPDTAIKSVLQIADRIRTSIEETEIYNEEVNLAIKMTISIGVSHLAGPGGSGRRLTENADKALYDAKVTRNTVSLFGGSKDS